jgi:hypothetical protein
MAASFLPNLAGEKRRALMHKRCCTEDSTWSSCLLQRCESRWRTGRACGEQRFGALRRSRPWPLRTSRKIELVPRKPIARDVTHDYMSWMLVCGMLRQTRRGTCRSSNVRDGQRYTRGHRETQQLPGRESSNCKAKKYLGTQIDRSSPGNLISSEPTARSGNSLAATTSG